MKTLFLLEPTITDDLLNDVLMEATSLSKLKDSEVENYVNGFMSKSKSAFSQEEQKNFVMTESMTVSKREKLKAIFCKVVSALGDSESLDWKEIIKSIILAATGVVFGGTLGALFLPFLVYLVAKAIKKGISSVCPV